MGIKRVVDTGFWTDRKVDDFSPEDKYFMLYLLTNPFSTQLGIYEISIKQVAFQLGYSMEAVKVLLDRFENKYGIIVFSPETNEVAIKNYLRHSIIKGGKPVEDCLWKEIQGVKSKRLISQVFRHIAGFDGLNSTVRKIIFDFDPSIFNDNDNENDNENDESCHDSLDDSSKCDETTGDPVIVPAKNVTPALSFDYSTTTFSPTMIAEVERWLKYKKERRETYKPTGLQALISEIQNNANRYGEQAVIDLIHTCMAANWRGIIFDKLKQPATQQPHHGGGYRNSPPHGVDRLLEMIDRGDFDE